MIEKMGSVADSSVADLEFSSGQGTSHDYESKVSVLIFELKRFPHLLYTSSAEG